MGVRLSRGMKRALCAFLTAWSPNGATMKSSGAQEFSDGCSLCPARSLGSLSRGGQAFSCTWIDAMSRSS